MKYRLPETRYRLMPSPLAMAEWIEIPEGGQNSPPPKSPLAMAEWSEIAKVYANAIFSSSPLVMAEWIEIHHFDIE